MNILRMVKAHIKIHGWPREPVRVGPATCGQPRYYNKTDCRTAHAYAEAISADLIKGEPPFWVFYYHRPCNVHDDASKVGGLAYGE